MAACGGHIHLCDDRSWAETDPVLACSASAWSLAKAASPYRWSDIEVD